MGEKMPENGCRLLFPQGFRFACTLCGKCCQREWNLPLDQNTYKKLYKTDFYNRIKTLNNGKEPFSINQGTKKLMIEKVDGHCIMKDSQGFCMIHSELGPSAKPADCRMFPFIIRPTPEGIYVGISFTCPTVWQNEGEPIENVTPEIRNYLNKKSARCNENPAMYLTEHIETDWRTYVIIEDFLMNHLKRISPLHKALWIPMIILMVISLNIDDKEVNSSSLADHLSRWPSPEALEQDSALNEFLYEDYLAYENLIAMGIISMLESVEKCDIRDNVEKLIGNHRLESRTFRKQISISGLAKYSNSHPCTWREEYYRKYINHLIWRKFLTRFPNVIQGISALNLIYPILDWYFYADAYCRQTEEPTPESAIFAIEEVESYILSHSEYFMDLFQKFSKDIIQRISGFIRNKLMTP